AGTAAPPYGYAEIKPKTSGTCLIASVENTTDVLASPWGNLSGSNASFDSLERVLQNAEVFLDFTAFGLDINPLTGPCFTLFGSLLVKTRASGSFTAQLADYAGPYLFGNFTTVQGTAGADQELNCNRIQATLQGVSLTAGATY